MRLMALIVLLLLPAAARAEERIVLGLSQEAVAITATFTGSDILIFGAVKRDQPPLAPPLEVVITVTGPLAPVMVRHKERRFGIWMNADEALIDAAPSFFALATSGPLDEVLSNTEDLRHAITLHNVIRSVGNAVTNSADYTAALERIRASKGVYQQREGSIDFEAETLFRTQMRLPANLTEGTYTARIFLTREGQVVDEYTAAIAVEKVGLERWLYSLAHQYPPLYGVLALAVAVLAGWAAAASFALLRR